jgi:hypothetical protein
MTEQVPEGLTEAEVDDRLEVDSSDDEDAGAGSEVDRWEDEGGHGPRRLSRPASSRHADEP